MPWSGQSIGGSRTRTPNEVAAYFRTLIAAWGPQNWWPAETQVEMIVGAFLTQNTAWTNVEKALANLRARRALSLKALRRIPVRELEELIRPAGYFRQKAARIKGFIVWLDSNYGGSLKRMFSRGTTELRDELLSLNGVGPETADSILLYAGQHEIFVVDAYTRRIFERHGLTSAGEEYDAIRSLVETALLANGPESLNSGTEAGKFAQVDQVPVPPRHVPSALSQAPRSPRAQRLNEFHGLLVQVGKHLCQSREAKCHLCPLAPFLPHK